MNDKLLFRFALETGEVMLSNGAETFRVEDTIKRILQTSKFQVTESFVTPTGIFVTLDDSSIDMSTQVKRIKYRTIDLNKVTKANEISRQYVEGLLPLEKAYETILSIKMEESPYNRHLQLLAISAASGFFALVFNGTPVDAVTACFVGFFMGILNLYLSWKFRSIFFVDFISGASIAVLSILFTSVFPLSRNIDLIIISSLMPLVPGLAITTAVRDAMQGDFISGVTRAVEAIFIAVSIASGVGIVLKLYILISGGLS